MTTIAARRVAYNWRVFGAWFLASSVGMGVCVMVALTLMWSLTDDVTQAAGERLAYLFGGAVLGLGLGLGTGLLTGFVLRRRLGGLGGWWLGSLLGGAGGGSILAPLAMGQEPDVAVWLVLAAVGAAIGVGQWLALRGRVARAGWWVLASAAAVAAGFGVAFQLGGEGREALAMGGLALVHGLISAGAMGGLLSEGG